jgi:hypothetical protein
MAAAGGFSIKEYRACHGKGRTYYTFTFARPNPLAGRRETFPELAHGLSHGCRGVRNWCWRDLRYGLHAPSRLDLEPLLYSPTLPINERVRIVAVHPASGFDFVRTEY